MIKNKRVKADQTLAQIPQCLKNVFKGTFVTSSKFKQDLLGQVSRLRKREDLKLCKFILESCNIKVSLCGINHRRLNTDIDAAIEQRRLN
jgi:hypothetical protein